MCEFVFYQRARKLPENKGKVLFYETNFELGNINRKPLTWSNYNIITKFRPKKWVSLFFGKVYENCLKIKEKCYFMKLASKWVIYCDTPYTPYTKLQVQSNSTSKDMSHYPTSTMSLSVIMAFKKKLSSLSNT